ncbi:DUF3891 family protein [Evansella sp. LMS18]|jgi:hypothetical protein|uniref:DUF3891 family protein n=1 Tax=Evansella sp. LMS18 TaxID=2924033 RepID=UPI0020D0C3DD|nr:DUF3891 family protein [Evansella sp. LMS18]UTR10701.1 DUF3891 family protein [Evansella sp. LMS18]
MIVKETANSYILIEQHYHAELSGELANKWRIEYFLGADKRESVELAIRMHDWCWQKLDKKPVFLSEEKQPASFTDYPLNEKIRAYTEGIEFMEERDEYAALLISSHYSSFFNGKGGKKETKFRTEEEGRQKELKQKLKIENRRKEFQFHFDLLQLCDNLSLYLCMNKWGASKDEEISWFRNGFPQQFAPLNNEKLYGEWESENKIILEPFPFSMQTVAVRIPYKKISKGEYTSESLLEEYKNTEYTYHEIKISPK